MISESKKLFASDQTSFKSFESHTIYQEEVDPKFADKHPRNALQKSSKTIADFDRLSSDSVLRQLYLDARIKEII